jgi:hypothetical protein
MAGTWEIEELKVCRVHECRLWASPVEDSSFRFRGTHLDGRGEPR